MGGGSKGERAGPVYHPPPDPTPDPTRPTPRARPPCRPNIFDLEIRSPDALYERVVEVDELVVLPLGDQPSQRNGANAAGNSTCVPQGGLGWGGGV